MEFCGVCDSLLRIKQSKGVATYYCPSCRKFKPWRKIKKSTVTTVSANETNQVIEVDIPKDIISICAHCRKKFSSIIGKTTTVQYANEYGEVGATYSTTQNTRFCSTDCRNRFMSNY